MSHIALPQPAPSPAGRERRSTASRILRASFIVMLVHATFKLVSLLQYAFISNLCSAETRDLFVFGFEGVLGLLFLVGEESLGPAFLPVFMERIDRESEESAWAFANTILAIQAAMIAAAVGFVAWKPEIVVNLVTKWQSLGGEDSYRRLAPEYARYLVLGLFGMSLGSTTYMLLNGYKRFFLAAFGDATLKLGIVGALAAAWVCRMDINGGEALWVLALGVALGSALKLLTHLVGLRRELFRMRLRVDLGNPGLRKFLWLLAPLFLGIVFSKVRDVYVNLRSLSDLGPGLMSARSFGWKIFDSIRFLIPYAVSIAVLPFFCELVDQKRRDELGAMVTRGARLIMLTCVPAAALLVAMSLPVARVLYQGGQYAYADCLGAAVANACYSLVLPFAALEAIFMQVFFANRRMKAVVLIGLLFSSLSMAITYIGIELLQCRGMYAIATVALAFTISRAMKTLALGDYMRRFLPVFPWQETAGYMLRLAVIAAGTGGAAWLARIAYERLVHIPLEGGRWVILPRLAPELVLAGAAGAAAGLGLAWLLCREETGMVQAWALARLRRSKEGVNP